MEITITPRKETSEVEMEVKVPAEDFTPFVNRTIAELSKDVSIKGFRKGKAPKDIAIAHIGYDRIMQEAMNSALPTFFARAAVDKDVQAVNRPAISVHEIGPDTPFRFTAVVEVIPEILLGDPKKLVAKKEVTEITNEQVTKEIKRIAKMRSTLATVERPAKTDDVVTVNFQVRVDGNVIEGGESKNHPITLGGGAFVPGFEDGLIGASTGEDKVFPITFPAEYSKKELQGKQAEVRAHINIVQERNNPALDDAFAKTVGAFETIKSLEEQIKKNMVDEAQANDEERHMGKLAEQLMETSTFGIMPPSLIEHEIDRRMEEFANMLGYQQKTLEEYVMEHATDMQALRNTMRESAEKHVKIGLALRELAKKHDISVSEEEVIAEANKQLANFTSVEHVNEKVDIRELRDYAQSTLKNKKTLELLASLAKA